jgi:hypothetical protein
MRNINEVLREKEAELQRLEKEIEALRLAASLLNEEGTAAAARAMVPVVSPKAPARSFEKSISEMPISGTPTLRQFP